MIKSILILFVLLNILSCTSSPKITITDGHIVESQECFKVETLSVVYYYQKEAGGFASIYDNEGNDWISFRKKEDANYPEGAANQFRGIPNAVYGGEDNGVGHPGFNKCKSWTEGTNKIVTESLNGKWKWEWIFEDDYVVYNIIRTDTSRGYWLLYEGTPGGSYKPNSYYWGTDKDGLLLTKPDYYKGPVVNDNWRWAYFGTTNVKRVFFLAQDKDDGLNDTYAILGNSEEGLNSLDGMTVFGFGRENINGLLRGENKFFIGFFDSPIKTDSDHERISKHISSIIKNN